MIQWTTKKTNQGFLVRSNHSFTLNNKHDAEKLCQLLNDYETKTEFTLNLETRLHIANINLKESIMSLNILKEDLNKIKNNLEGLK